MPEESPHAAPTCSTQDMYEHLGIRPGMYAGRVHSVEAFVAGAEAALDALADEPRPDRYVDFPGAGGFGAESFTSRFERRRRCRIGFVPCGHPYDAEQLAGCEARFRKKILWHFREFVKWRRKLPPERRSARIDAVYEAAIAYPESYGERYLGAEAFMVGIENGRCCVEGRRYPPDGYYNFMGERRFGAYSFTTFFHRGISIGTAFVPLDGFYDIENSLELERRFKLEFADHWLKFLEWRRSRQPA